MMAQPVKFNDIITRRSEVLRKEKSYRPISDLKNSIKRIKLRKSFKNALNKENDVSIICEYKPASPSLGHISNLKVEDIIPQFESGGASAASILTEKSYFNSSIENLKIACKISKLPLLRKDFIMDEYQIYESRASGASAVLLMADVYPHLAEGIQLTKYLGMDALVECKNREEIEKALEAGAEIIGINNRDFTDFTIDLNRTRNLAEFVPSNVTLVSESGVKTGSDVELLASFGADAILIGTSVMKSDSISQKLDELLTTAKNSRTNGR
jgi:indole-3-glycerol phosphate synthase